MNAYTMSEVAGLGMPWLEQNQNTQDLGISCGEGGDMMLDQGSPYFISNSISNQSLDDDISNMTMEEGMDFLPESSDGSYMDDDNSGVFMITTSTQTTASCYARKIRPIKHPGLVLKTPIAYQSNTDPSVIPIQKDGIAICEKCGAIGVKHAFYTKERRFCSMMCARSYNGLLVDTLTQTQESLQDDSSQSAHLTPESSPFMSHNFKMTVEENFAGYTLAEPFPQIAPPPSPVLPVQSALNESISNRRRPDELDAAEPYVWDPLLLDPNFIAAPVTCFIHAPLCDIWDNILIGMKVEVENTDSSNGSEVFSDSFWVATVMNVVGYKALLRYEGFGLDDSKDFWVSICSNQVHSVGWCATRGKPLIPPKSIQDRYSDWKEFLCKRLTGARTLPSNFSNKVTESMKSRFQCGLNLEVIDKERISQVKLASIHKIVGKRLNIKYHDCKADPYGFWCHEDSPLIHPVGWAKKVGHNIVAPHDYLNRVSGRISQENDAKLDLFTQVQIGSPDNSETAGFNVGMKLEAIDPLNLSSICAATIMKVLRCGYIVIRIDTYEVDATGADWFCYHVKSSSIFPVGFCHKNNIPLTPPFGYDIKTFTWEKFLKDGNNLPVTEELITHSIPSHGFGEGMKLEAADLMDPRLICAATIDRIVGHLMKIQFDGWDHDFDQWLELESCSVYPVGWAHSVNYVLAGPSNKYSGSSTATPLTKQQKVPKKRGRKKKKEFPYKSKLESEQIVIKQEVIDPEDTKESIKPQEIKPILEDAAIETKTTSSVKTESVTDSKTIPALENNTHPPENKISPENWTVDDVVNFFKTNDCGNYCDIITKNKIDGKTFLYLTNSDVLQFTNGKVGPSVKIFNLVQLLKEKANPTTTRHRGRPRKNVF